MTEVSMRPRGAGKTTEFERHRARFHRSVRSEGAHIERMERLARREVWARDFPIGATVERGDGVAVGTVIAHDDDIFGVTVQFPRYKITTPHPEKHLKRIDAE